MEIYQDLKNPKSQEFQQLLNNELSKQLIEEGKVIEGIVNKITDKFVFLLIEGLKSEPVLDINELKSLGMTDGLKIGNKISVSIVQSATIGIDVPEDLLKLQKQSKYE